MIVLRDVGVIAVFYAPGLQRWVVRQWDRVTSLRAGDAYWNGDTEPSDDELRALWGADVQIIRGYRV